LNRFEREKSNKCLYALNIFADIFMTRKYSKSMDMQNVTRSFPQYKESEKNLNLKPDVIKCLANNKTGARGF